jgi:hypothetical protein
MEGCKSTLILITCIRSGCARYVKDKEVATLFQIALIQLSVVLALMYDIID